MTRAGARSYDARAMPDAMPPRASADAVRALAGAIAHDFNNILGVLLLHLAIAKMQVEPDHEAAQTLSDAERVAFRAQALTQQLLAVSGAETTIRRTTAIGDLVQEAVDSVVLCSDVKCNVSIAGDLWPVDCDAGQIGYAITALVRHAAAILPHRAALAVRADNVVVSAPGRAAVPAARYVQVTIEGDQPARPAPNDHGRPGDLEFAVRRAHAFIERHAGMVTSATDEAIRFVVFLPASDRAPADDRSAAARDRRLKVLLMDDEGLIRAVAGDVLQRLGHVAEIARDGVEAIALYREARHAGVPFDVVILDLTVLGGVGARDAIRDLTAFDPDVRAIVSTGYSNDPIVENYREHGFRALLMKPYRVAELQDALRRAMASD